ncbi:MAG TPA: hypothetical protein VF727_00260 [Allosphingosinicella sp.]
MASPRAASAGLIALAAAATLFAPAKAQQPQFRVGDRVLCQVSGVGEWRPGTVEPYDQRDLELDPAVAQTGRYYRVRLDERPAGWQPDTCMAGYVRSISGANASAPPARAAGQASAPATGTTRRPVYNPARPRSRAPATPAAPQAGAAAAGSTTQPPGAGGPAPRNLRGTAWKVESRGSTGVQVFLFCNSGRWEIVGSQLFNGGVSPVGTYTQAGSRLTTRNQDDGTVQPWTLTWPGGDRLDANDGQVTLRLHYNGRASC